MFLDRQQHVTTMKPDPRINLVEACFMEIVLNDLDLIIFFIWYLVVRSDVMDSMDQLFDCVFENPFCTTILTNVETRRKKRRSWIY